MPTNLSSPFKTYFIDKILSLNLLQTNRFGNNLDKILDLIFFNENFNFSLYKCLVPISPSDMHHVALVLKLEFYAFREAVLEEKITFN